MDVVPVHAAEALDADRVPALEVGAVEDGGVGRGGGDGGQVGVDALKDTLSTNRISCQHP